MGYEVFYLVNFYLCTPEYTLSRYFFHSTCYLVFTISLKNPKLSHFTNPFKSKILKLYLFLNLNFQANNDFWLCNSFDFWMQKGDLFGQFSNYVQQYSPFGSWTMIMYFVFGSHDKDQDLLFVGPLGGGHWMPLFHLEVLQAGRPQNRISNATDSSIEK